MLGGWQAVGVVVVGVGILLVRGPSGTADRRGVVLALAIAATIAGYTLADAQGIEHASPIAYLELVLVPAALAGLIFHAVAGRVDALRAALTPGRWARLRSARSPRTRSSSVRSRSPRHPRSPRCRETSVLFAVALGALVLREPVGGARAAGAALVVLGVALVALG